MPEIAAEQPRAAAVPAGERGCRLDRVERTIERKTGAGDLADGLDRAALAQDEAGVAWTRGFGTTRTTTSVRIPNRPSEPRTSSRRSGPAADAGSGGRTIEPAGASRRPPAKRSSIRPNPIDCWPTLRAATQPPSVERSHDCGKWPSVRPCGSSAASTSGRRAAPNVARPPVVQVAKTGECLHRDGDDRGLLVLRRRHSADDARPATERDQARAQPARPIEQVADLRAVGRSRDRVRHSTQPAAPERDPVGEALATGVADAIDRLDREPGDVREPGRCEARDDVIEARVAWRRPGPISASDPQCRRGDLRQGRVLVSQPFQRRLPTVPMVPDRDGRRPRRRAVAANDATLGPHRTGSFS